MAPTTWNWAMLLLPRPRTRQRHGCITSPGTKTESTKPASNQSTLTDLYGDPLPSGAIARLGTVRFRHAGFLYDVLLSPDGRRLYSAGDEAIEVWDTRTGHRLRRIALAIPPRRVDGIDLSPDGKLLALEFCSWEQNAFLGYDQRHGGLSLWRRRPGTWQSGVFSGREPTGEDRFRQPDCPQHLGRSQGKKDSDARKGKGGGRAEVRCLAFSPNDKPVGLSAPTGVCVWDLTADKELHQLDPGTKAILDCGSFPPTADCWSPRAFLVSQARTTRSIFGTWRPARKWAR